MGKTTVSVSYTAANLEDIAKMFDGLAAEDERKSKFESSGQKVRFFHKGACAAYKDAAFILRSTKLEVKA